MKEGIEDSIDAAAEIIEDVKESVHKFNNDIIIIIYYYYKINLI